MQISPIKNSSFEKPSRNLSNRTKVKILKKKFFGYLSKKFLFRVCSVTAEMFEHRNSGENRRKRSEIFFENLRRAFDLGKKNSKLSHACVTLISHRPQCQRVDDTGTREHCYDFQSSYTLHIIFFNFLSTYTIHMFFNYCLKIPILVEACPQSTYI
jgi:hypothetical protein